MISDLTEWSPPANPLREFDRPEFFEGSRVGHRLRWIIGVQDSLLNWVPEERARYTRLGAVVLNTALMAAFASIVATSSVTHGSWLPLVPVGLFWGLMILTIDALLIASTHGATHSKLKVFLPRLVVSLLLGIAIAEPLVLWVFGASIRTEIADYRQSEIGKYESRLQQCNPDDGETPKGPDCANYLVNIPNNALAIQHQLDSDVALRDQTLPVLNDLNQQVDKLDRIARQECAGIAGPETTGRAGDGPECTTDRQTAQQFRDTNHINDQVANFTKLQQDITTLTGALSTARKQSAAQISTAIADKVAEKQRSQREPDLLDQMDALGRLSDRSTTVWIGSWVLRLLLITIDTLPVLSKLMGGTTTYDVLVAQRKDAAKRSHTRHIQLHDLEESTDFDGRSRRTESALREEIRRIEDDERDAKIRRKADLAAEIDRIAAEIENGQDLVAENE